MATRGQILAGAGFAALAGYGIYRARKKKKKKKRKPTQCAPYQWDPTPVAASIHALLDEGAQDADEIAAIVATEHFGSYPGGGTAAFPPPAQAPAGVACVWERTLALVDAIVEERGFQADPWEIVDEWTSPENKPLPGTLFKPKAGSGWGIASVAREALENAGIPNPKNQNGVFANQLALRNMIECSPWNDALYGVAGAGGKGGPGGRGINLNASHADNLHRMTSGLPPRRAATGKASHDGTGGHLPFIWIPKLETGAPVPVVAQFEDGRSGINPPAEILAFGIENVPPGIYGCEPYQEAAGDLPLG